MTAISKHMIGGRGARSAAATAIALLAGAAFSEPSVAALSGRLWVIPANRDATFADVPTRAPDVTFSTDHINFIGAGPTSINTSVLVDYTVGTFLQSTHTTTNIVYSGQTNPYLRAAVTANTRLSNGVSGGASGTYESLIDLRGGVLLKTGDTIVITHDDGVSLKIDGTLISGPGTGSAFATSDHFFWSGTTGYHSVEIVYVEEDGGPAQLVFSPAAQIP